MENTYESELKIINNLGIGGCIDAFISENLLFTIGNGISGIGDHVDIKISMSGSLYIYDLKNPASPSLVGMLSGLGNVRQMEVYNSIAYIVSREDGMFIIDVSNPKKPALISRIDAIEFCTGIDIYGELAFLSCRHSGVQIMDISDPYKPKYVSTLKIGEAQSVDVSDGILYAGIWGVKELVLCDVKNPHKAREISRIAMDGRGDGVFVRGNLCFAATGHHARDIVKEELSDPAFGRGNGMEIYDVGDPSSPKLLSRTKINRFTYMFYDMWDVTLNGDHAFLSHSYNGVYAFNVKDPNKPVLKAHATLPQIEGTINSSPVGGIALGDGFIYAAGILSDLHVIEAPSLTVKEKDDDNYSFNITKNETEKAEESIEEIYGELPHFYHYKTEGQLYSAAFYGDYIFAAAGSAGLHILHSGNGLSCKEEHATKGFAMDLKIIDNTLFTAEGLGGLAIYNIATDAKINLSGRYEVDGYTIRQVIISPDKKYAILQVGSKWIHIVNIEDPARPRLVFWDTFFKGQVFHRQLSYGLFKDRYAAYIWHSAGFFWYDLYADQYGDSIPKYAGFKCQQSFLAFNGIYCSKDLCLITHDKGYVLPDIKNTESLSHLKHYRIDNYDLTGKPVVYGNNLYISNRLNGTITELDISKIDEPKLIRCYKLKGNPDIIIKNGNKTAIPAGYQGLLVYSE